VRTTIPVVSPLEIWLPISTCFKPTRAHYRADRRPRRLKAGGYRQPNFQRGYHRDCGSHPDGVKTTSIGCVWVRTTIPVVSPLEIWLPISTCFKPELDTQQSLVVESAGTVKADEAAVASAQLQLDWTRNPGGIPAGNLVADIHLL
jgi:hypothetical protein